MLTDRLYEEVKTIWHAYYEHPFVKGIGTGELSLDSFRYYMIQDYLYLLNYSKLFALGVVKAHDEEIMRYYSKLVSNTLDVEMAIHKSYMKRLDISDEELASAIPAKDNISYTSYMLWVADNEGLLELTVAVLACAWSYQKIGKKLAENTNALHHEFYGEWIAGYSSGEFEKGNEMIFHIVNELGENCSDKAYQNLKNIFIRCSNYEMDFWDMSYEMRD